MYLYSHIIAYNHTPEMFRDLRSFKMFPLRFLANGIHSISIESIYSVGIFINKTIAIVAQCE